MTRMIEGIEVAELYTSGDRPAPLAGAAAGRPARRWQIRQRHTGPDTAAVNAAVLDDLRGGVEAVELHDLEPGGLADALEGVRLDVAPVCLSANADGAGAWALMGLWSSAVDDDACAGTFGIDPLGAGEALDPAAEATLVAAAVVSAERFPQVRSVGVDAARYLDAGPALELGYSLAVAVEYLRVLDMGGLDVDEAAAELEFTYGVTADQFVTIAKLRAARAMWHRVVSVCGGNPDVVRQRQRAITAPPRGDDAWSDVLRATTACFAAGVGGADAVTVIPFDSGDHSDAVARRMARNTHHLLLDEAHVAEVTDPAAGAPYVESLTHTFARQGWAVFQAVEAAGGMGAALESGVVDHQLASTVEAES
jgi:methylmalonyl-CoA mutase